MDLIRPMHVESLEGKIYVFVCVNDYSIYTLVEFIRNKSDTLVAFEALSYR